MKSFKRVSWSMVMIFIGALIFLGPAGLSQKKPYAGTTITVNLVSGLATVPATKALIPIFEAETGIKVNLTTVTYANLHDKQVLELSSPKGAYDIIEIYNEAVPEYADAGWIVDYRSFPTFEKDMKGFFKKAYSICEWEGKIVGIPFDGGGRVFCYNEKILKDNGLAIMPVDGWTWDYIRAAAKKVTRDINGDGEPDIWGWAHEGMMGGYSCMDFNPWLWGFGGDILDDYVHPTKCLINSPQAVQALTWYADFRNVDKVSPPGDTTYSEVDVCKLIRDGKVVMSINDPLMHGTHFYNPAMSRVVGQIKFADIPVKEGVHIPMRKHRIGIWELCIAQNSRKKKAAYEFVRFITSEKVAMAWTLAGVASFRESVYKDPILRKKYPYFDYIPRFFETGVRWIHNPEATKVMFAIGKAVTSALAGEKSPKEALDIAKKEIDTFYIEGGYPGYKR